MKSIIKLTLIFIGLSSISTVAYAQKLSTHYKLGLGGIFDQPYQLNKFLVENKMPVIKKFDFPVAFLGMNTAYKNLNLSLTFGVMSNFSNRRTNPDGSTQNITGGIAEIGLNYSIYHTGLSMIKLGGVLSSRTVNVKIYPDQSRVDMANYGASSTYNHGIILNYKPTLLGISGTYIYNTYGLSVSYLTTVNSPGWSILNYSETANPILEQGNTFEFKLFMTLGSKSLHKK